MGRSRDPLGEPRIQSVLIVDDNDDLRDMLSELLEGEGYKVAAVSGSFEALDCLKSGLRPALIVLDVMMPRMSGVELLSQLRSDKEHAETPVVLMSGSAPTNLPPGTRILRKPFELDRFLDLVRSHCWIEPPASLAELGSRAD